MRRLNFTVKEKLEIINEYISGNGGFKAIGQLHGIDAQTVRRWFLKYREHGENGLKNREAPVCYTDKFKLKCIKDVLNGKGSIDEITAKNNISDPIVLRRWIKKYNSHIETNGYEPVKEGCMAAARRKTTQGERKEIVEYCLAHDMNFQCAASKYNVSYGQVYSWVRKYIEKGEDGLSDKRGRRIPVNELTEEDGLRRKVALLEKQLEEEKMKVRLLKKVKELERGWY